MGGWVRSEPTVRICVRPHEASASKTFAPVINPLDRKFDRGRPVYGVIADRASTDRRAAACPPPRSRLVGRENGGSSGGGDAGGDRSDALVGLPPTPKVPAGRRGDGALQRRRARAVRVTRPGRGPASMGGSAARGAGPEIREDPVDHQRLGDERDDPHGAMAGRARERVDLENLLQGAATQTAVCTWNPECGQDSMPAACSLNTTGTLGSASQDRPPLTRTHGSRECLHSLQLDAITAISGPAVPHPRRAGPPAIRRVWADRYA